MEEAVSIKKDDRGKIISAELVYTPFTRDGFTVNGVTIKEAKYSSKNIKQLLGNHEKNAIQLREMSDYLYNTNGMYRRLIDTIVNLVSFEHIVTPINTKRNELNERLYEKKYNGVREYIWNCNFDITLGDILFKLIKYGRYSAFDRGAYLQPLPLDYTRIIGINSDGNAILQFNFAYFEQFTDVREQNMQLHGFDPIFRKLYMDYRKGIDNPKENFVSDLNWRTLPVDKTVTIKIGSNVESKEGIGLLYGSVDDIIFYDEIRELDRIIIGSQKRKIIVQQLPVDDEHNSVLGEQEIKQAHENLKATLPPNVGCLTVLGGTKFEEIPLQISAIEKGKMAEVKDDVLTSAGVGEGSLKGGNFSTGVLNIDIITNTVQKILKQVENLWLNRKIKNIVGNGQHQFRFKFLGITSFNRDKIIDSFDGLLDKGGNLSPSVSARGFDIVEYIDILDAENAFGYKDKFEPLMTSHTTSGDGAGRPSGSGEGGDNTDKTNNNGSNNNPSPSK